MPRNAFDQACRYLAKLDPIGFLCWLMGLNPVALLFRGWLDTRRIPFPGEPDRVCDTVAHVEDVQGGQRPWALILEFQAEPDPLFFGRSLIYAGQLWMEVKPTEERGDRFDIGIVVVNLTGQGNSGRAMRWEGTQLLIAMQPQEINLPRVDAKTTLDAIAAGRAPRGILALIPLMQGGGELAIIQQWLSQAAAEPDPKRRGDHGGLALVFAEAADCQDAWKQALKGWNMKQSQQVLEWQAEARKEGEAQGRAEAILRVLRLRFGTLPSELESHIRAEIVIATLDRWLELAVTSGSLGDFRVAVSL